MSSWKLVVGEQSMSKRPFPIDFDDDGISSVASSRTSSSGKRSRSSLFSSALSIDIPDDHTASTDLAASESECDTPPRPGWTKIGGGKFGSVWHDGFADVAVKCIDRGKLSERARVATIDDVAQFRSNIEEIGRRVARGEGGHKTSLRKHMALPVADSIEQGDPDTNVILMQLPFVAGKSLRSVMQTMPAPKVRQIICQVFQLLDMLNAMGIYHNDVTVNNIVVTPFDEPGWALVDWDAATVDDVARLLDNLNLQIRWRVKDVKRQRPDVVHFMIHLMQFGDHPVDVERAILECEAVRAVIRDCKGNDATDREFLARVKNHPETLVFEPMCIAAAGSTVK